MFDKFYDLARKGFSVAFESYFIAGPSMKIKLYRDQQYATYLVDFREWEYFESQDPIKRDELIARILDELEQKFYHDFGKERQVLYP